MKPPFTITNKMLNQIVHISQVIGRLEVEYERQLHLRKDNRIRSIQSSLAIENNSLSVQQVTDIINGKRVLGQPKEIQEVKNAYDAYEQILQFDPYSLDGFLTAHGLMTHGLTDNSGDWRNGDIGIYDSVGNLIHMGARPQFVPKLMTDLFAWAKKDDTPMLIKSAVMHYEIEVIHPFSDGNGRMGRLWQTVLLSSENPVFAWLPIETIIYENQSAYYASLGKADQSNESTVFVEFMLSSILAMLSKYATNDNRYQTNDLSTAMSDKPKEMSDKPKEMSDKPKEMSDTLTGLNKNERQAYMTIAHYLQNNAHSQQTINNNDAQKLLGKSSATVRRYLSALVTCGLLEAVGERKSRYYRLIYD